MVQEKIREPEIMSTLVHFVEARLIMLRRKKKKYPVEDQFNFVPGNSSGLSQLKSVSNESFFYSYKLQTRVYYKKKKEQIKKRKFKLGPLLSVLNYYYLSFFSFFFFKKRSISLVSNVANKLNFKMPIEQLSKISNSRPRLMFFISERY